MNEIAQINSQLQQQKGSEPNLYDKIDKAISDNVTKLMKSIFYDKPTVTSLILTTLSEIPVYNKSFIYTEMQTKSIEAIYKHMLFIAERYKDT